MPLFRRKDGDLVRDLPPYRRMMPLLLPTRTESAVYFEQRIDVGPALAFLREFNADRGERRASLFHLVLWALVQTLGERPRLNRFTMGGRIYQRRGIWISYSAKKAMDDDSPVFMVKREMEAGKPFADLVEAAHGGVAEGRSDEPTATDKELSILLKLPLVLLKLLIRVVRRLDHWNLVPHWFIRGDPMYASVLVTNLGSIKIDAAYHHNFEYGNTPLFLAIGQIHEVPVVGEQGRIDVRKEMVLRWTYDERIEDGLYCARALDYLRDKLEKPSA